MLFEAVFLLRNKTKTMYNQRFRRVDSRITLLGSPIAIATLEKAFSSGTELWTYWLNRQQFLDHKPFSSSDSLRFSKISVDELQTILPFFAASTTAIIFCYDHNCLVREI